MKKRNVCMLLAAALSCSLLLTACGGGGTSTTTPGTSTPSTSTSAPAGSGGASTGAESGYTFRTSESNRVVTENGTFTKDQVSAPVLITSFGQSADVSMLDALMKEVGVHLRRHRFCRGRRRIQDHHHRQRSLLQGAGCGRHLPGGRDRPR